MKIRITDLLDQYHDESDLLTSSEAQSTEVDDIMKETTEIKQSKHRFGWKEGLAVAAAAAVFVLGGFGVSRLLRKGKAPETPVAYDSVDSTANTTPIESVDSSKEPVVDPVTKQEVALTPELQQQANRFLTRFAEQGITYLDKSGADAYSLVSFAHLYYKINDSDAFVYQSLNDESYETLTKDQVNQVLLKMMNQTVEVTDGTDFTALRGDNYAVHEMFRDGRYWFPAADGDMHSQFAVCEQIEDNGDGTWTLHYRAYDFMGPMEMSTEQKDALSCLTVRQAEADDEHILVMSGAAVVQLDNASDFGWYLLTLNASYVDALDPVRPDKPLDPENPLSDPELRGSISSLLSRLAEQDVVSLDELKEDPAALMNFAHRFAKLHPDDISVIRQQTRDGIEYETMQLSDVNEILTRLFDVQVDPAEGEVFDAPLRSNNSATAFVENGVIWFPAGEGYTYPCIAVCTNAEKSKYGYEDGDVSAELECIAVEFNVYETTLEDFETGKAAEYCQLTAQDAEALAEQKVFYLTEKGTAHITVEGSIVLDYERTWVEPEGWEEEFPQEYPVTEYRIEGEGFLQQGEINLYRYEQLPEAEGYVDILTRIAREALNSPDAVYEIDSPHDGYANWIMETPQGGSSVSGSDITGRFTYWLNPAFDRVLEQSQRTVSDRPSMEQAARDFTAQFSGITGNLTLVGSKDDDLHYHDERFTGLRDLIVPTVIYYFRSEENSRIRLTAQNGLEVPVSCGDSSVDDLNDHVFAVTVWPDGTVVCGNNYITRARIVSDGTMQIPDESAMNRILSFMTSFTENDVFVLESAGIEGYSVYFGYGTIDPILTVNYHFESNPDDHQSTQITIPGLLD